MAMTATYTTFAGMVVHQRKNGVDTELISDPLGSVVKTKDASGNETSRTEYWPFGEVQSSTGSNPTPFGFVATLGYYRDLATRLYVRARYLRPDQGRWQTVDPFYPFEAAYIYADSYPIILRDASGYRPDRWIPPFNPDEDDVLCRGRLPRSISTVPEKWWVTCAGCLGAQHISDISNGDSDKESHFIAGCLSRIRCEWACRDSVGSLKEYDDFLFGGTVSRADALATDDGWDAVDKYLKNYYNNGYETLGGPFVGGQVKFCKQLYKRSIWPKMVNDLLTKRKPKGKPIHMGRNGFK